MPHPLYPFVMSVRFWLEKANSRSLAVWGTCFFFVAGCDLPERPELTTVSPTKPTGIKAPLTVDNTESLEPPSPLDNPSFETWDAYYVNNQHIGYSHVKVSPTTGSLGADLNFELDHRVYQRRGKARVLQRLLMTSAETNDGRLVGFDGTQQVGLAVTEFNGTMDGSKLVVEVRAGSNIERSEIPWEYNYRGMFAVEQSLRANPMLEAGQTRALKMLISGRYQPATARLRCSGAAVVPMLDGSEKELTEINVEIESETGSPIYSAIWIDRDGNIVRTFSSALNIIAYRTTEERATRLEPDDLIPVAMPVGGKMEKPEKTKRVAYRIKPIGVQPDPDVELVQPAPGQYVRIADDGSLQVLVSRQDEKPTGGFESEEPAPAREDRRPNFFINSSAEIITKFASAAIGKRKLSRLEIATELAATMNRTMIVKPEERGLAKASDVARLGVGDDTRCAIMLAALLRAQKIPSRVAIGLRFVPEQESRQLPQRLVAHVWTLAHVGDRWVHLDATEGGIAAADRLLIACSDLADEQENEFLGALSSAVGRIEVEILAVKY